MHVVWVLLMEKVYAHGSNMDDLIANSLICMMARLHSMYKRRAKEHPAENLTRLHRCSRKMVGDPNSHKMKTKASETFGLLIFLVEELSSLRAGRIPDPANLLLGGQSLLNLVDIWNAAGWRLSPQELTASFRAFNSFVGATCHIEEMRNPKRHTFVIIWYMSLPTRATLAIMRRFWTSL